MLSLICITVNSQDQKGEALHTSQSLFWKEGTFPEMKGQSIVQVQLVLGLFAKAAGKYINDCQLLSWNVSCSHFSIGIWIKTNSTFIIISYIWPISPQNTEAIHKGKDLYDSDPSCPGDKRPLMSTAIQSRKNTVVLSALEGNTGKCRELKAISRGPAFTIFNWKWGI